MCNSNREKTRDWGEYFDQVAAISTKMRLILEGVFALYDGGRLDLESGKDEKMQRRLQLDALDTGLFELRDLLNEMQTLELKMVMNE